MTKAEALAIFTREFTRELLREDGPRGGSFSETDPLNLAGSDPNPRPQFDFDESVCEHGGLMIDRALCPVHGPDATGPAPTAEELDDITSETHDEANPLIAKAERLRRQREARQAQQRLYPEEIPMSGLATPPGDAPIP